MEGKTHLNKDGLPTYFINDATHDCYFRRYYEKRKACSRALMLLLLVFCASKMLFGWFTFSGINELNDEDQYRWIETQETNSIIEDYKSPFYLPGVLTVPKCEPSIKWDGPKEILINQQNISGLVFRVSGILPYGSVIIRQDPQAKDYINITNHIYVGDESLQEKVDIKISYIEEDYSITVETPHFINFPPNKKKCIHVNTIITIPNNLEVFRSLSVDVPNSWITTDSLNIVDFAYVNLKTTNGHINVDELSAANIDVSTVNGHINGAFIVGESLEVRSINGPININTTPNPWSDIISVGVTSFSGNLNIEVDGLMKYHQIDLKGRTVNGGIVATMPKTYKGDFLVSSITGYAYVEGQGINFRKDRHNIKEGYKKRNCKQTKQNFYDLNNSNLTLSVVTGASELYFV